MPGNLSVSVRWQGFGLAKRGNSPDEYEDAYAAAPRAGRFAVADGASESSFTSLWARLLVEGFVHPVKAQDSQVNWLAPLRQRWAAEVDGLSLPWYAEAKREQGAFATFLGLVFRRPTMIGGGGRWRALAVGDSCLFQVRKESLVKAFPVSRSEDFGNRPALLCSRPAANDRERQQQGQSQGRWRAGDRFFLMTDALAEWFLRQHETDGKPWQALDAVVGGSEPQAAFSAWVEELRLGEALRNDDVTLVWIALGEPTTAALPPDEAASPDGATPPEPMPGTD